jgi:hypothetical protein
MTLPVPMRANAPRFGTFGGGLRFNTSQHFYSYVSDTDKVPRRSAPFHNGAAPRPLEGGNQDRSAPMTCGARDGTWLAAAGPNASLLLGIADRH